MSVALPMPSQRGHMPPATLKLRLSVLPPPRSIVIAPAPRTEGMLKENAWGPPMCGSPEPAEDDPQHRVGVGHGADGGADVGAHPLLVDDDRGRQPFERVDVGPGQRRHEALHEGAVGLVDQPLRLGGDRVEDERALARAGDAGEHRQPALRDVEADVAEVVLAGAPDLDRAPVAGQALSPTAFFTSSAIRASTAGVSSVTAKATGHISPSSSRASGWKPNVEYRTLNFEAGWKKQMILPSLA